MVVVVVRVWGVVRSVVGRIVVDVLLHWIRVRGRVRVLGSRHDVKERRE